MSGSGDPLADLQALVLDIISLVGSPASVTQWFKVAADIEVLVKDAPGVVSDLKELFSKPAAPMPGPVQAAISAESAPQS